MSVPRNRKRAGDVEPESASAAEPAPAEEVKLNVPNLTIQTIIVGRATGEVQDIDIKPGSVITLYMHWDTDGIRAIRFNDPVCTIGNVKNNFQPFNWDTGLKCTNIDFFGGEHHTDDFNGIWMDVEGRREGAGYDHIDGLKTSTRIINRDAWYTPIKATVWTDRRGEYVVGVRFTLKLTKAMEVGDQETITFKKTASSVPPALHHSSTVNSTSKEMDIKTDVVTTITTTNHWTIKDTETVGIKLKATVKHEFASASVEVARKWMHEDTREHEISETHTETKEICAKLQPGMQLEILTRPPYTVRLTSKVQIPVAVTWGDETTNTYYVKLDNSVTRSITNEVEYEETPAKKRL